MYENILKKHHFSLYLIIFMIFEVNKNCILYRINFSSDSKFFIKIMKKKMLEYIFRNILVINGCIVKRYRLIDAAIQANLFG